MSARVIRHEVVQPQDASYRLIPLTRNQNAIVDAGDYESLVQYSWHAKLDRHTKSYYARRSVRIGTSVRTVCMHQQVLGCSGKKQGDHRNGNTLDNRRSNLRICTHSQNVKNSKRQKNNTSGFPGVFRREGGKWIATIVHNKKRKYLGCFESREEAAKARDVAALKLHGEFARTFYASADAPEKETKG